MKNISITREVAANPNLVWERIGSPEKLAAWHPAIATSEMASDGRTRTCVLADGATITEEIVSRDDAAREYTYRIVGGPLPVEDYVSTLRVTESTTGAAVTWEGRFDVLEGAPPDEVAAMVRGVYEAGLSALADSF